MSYAKIRQMAIEKTRERLGVIRNIMTEDAEEGNKPDPAMIRADWDAMQAIKYDPQAWMLAQQEFVNMYGMETFLKEDQLEAKRIK